MLGVVHYLSDALSVLPVCKFILAFSLQAIKIYASCQFTFPIQSQLFIRPSPSFYLPVQSSQPCKSLPSFVSFCCYFLFLNSIPDFCTWDPLIIIIPVSTNKPVTDSELPLLCAQINLQLTSWAHINKKLTKLMVSVSSLAPDALLLFKLHLLLHLSVSKRKQDVYGPEGL